MENRRSRRQVALLTHLWMGLTAAAACTEGSADYHREDQRHLNQMQWTQEAAATPVLQYEEENFVSEHQLQPLAAERRGTHLVESRQRHSEVVARQQSQTSLNKAHRSHDYCWISAAQSQHGPFIPCVFLCAICIQILRKIREVATRVQPTLTEHPEHLAKTSLPPIQSIPQDGRQQRRSHRAYKHTQGDGNCFWRSIAQKQWRRAKAHLHQRFAMHSAQFSQQEQKDLTKAFQRDQWANRTTLRYVAQQLQVTIDIYTPVGGSCKWSHSHTIVPQGQSRGHLALAFQNQHYSRLMGGLSARKILKIA